MNIVTFYEKELEIPQEIKDLFDEYVACNICRDKCIDRVFSARRAVYYAKRAIKAERKAWNLVYDLWPEVRESSGCVWFYHPEKQMLVKHRGQKI